MIEKIAWYKFIHNFSLLPTKQVFSRHTKSRILKTVQAYVSFIILILNSPISKQCL